MALQSIDQRRCVSCNRWGGSRSPGEEPGTVQFDEHLDRGLCIEGPWHGSLRSSRTACGRWTVWLAVEPGPGK